MANRCLERFPNDPTLADPEAVDAPLWLSRFSDVSTKFALSIENTRPAWIIHLSGQFGSRRTTFSIRRLAARLDVGPELMPVNASFVIQLGKPLRGSALMLILRMAIGPRRCRSREQFWYQCKRRQASRFECLAPVDNCSICLIDISSTSSPEFGGDAEAFPVQ